MKKVIPDKIGPSNVSLRWFEFIVIMGMFFILYCNAAYSFKSGSVAGHTGATQQGLGAVSYTASNGEILKFTSGAIQEIADANDEVDAGFGFMKAVPHCDNEELTACSKRILNLRTQAVAAVSNPANRDGAAARQFLGQALHTLQDFYAHSNWVNNPGPSNTSYNPDLGVTVIPQLKKNQQTCVDDIMNDNKLIAFGLTHITTGYFGHTPDGKCAHGIIPSAGIHKDKPGRPFYEEAFRQAIAATTAFTNPIIQDLNGDEDAIRALMGL
jgi:hypothetical protein